MKRSRLVGAVMLVFASGLGYWGYEKAHSVSVQVGQVFGAALPLEVMLAYGGSALLMLAGLWLVIKS